jgi:2-polyprenyl-3-methyl-5-hydroxy-6-metoxy-1,4-benzoquinol methylase
MKTASREHPNRWATAPRDRDDGAEDQNSSRSFQWAALQEKFRPRGEMLFSLTSFIELIAQLTSDSSGSATQPRPDCVFGRSALGFLRDIIVTGFVMADFQSTSRNREHFVSAYAGQAPWDIGKAQPAFERAADKIVGSVLDAGCGTGENALFLANRGHVVTGFDFLEEPIARAKRKACIFLTPHEYRFSFVIA